MPRVKRSAKIDTRRRRNPAFERKYEPMKQESPDVDRIFVVEKLLDKRFTQDGQEEYLVRWQNYTPEWDTWEPRSELERNCLDMLQEFNRIPTSEGVLDRLHCICLKPYRFAQGGMIQCSYCLTWYHFTCLQMGMEEANSYAKYYCAGCRETDPSRKSVVKVQKLATFYGASLDNSLRNS